MVQNSLLEADTFCQWWGNSDPTEYEYLYVIRQNKLKGADTSHERAEETKASKDEDIQRCSCSGRRAHLYVGRKLQIKHLLNLLNVSSMWPIEFFAINGVFFCF